MVVSIGWFQIITWKMGVSPNIHWKPVVWGSRLLYVKGHLGVPLTVYPLHLAGVLYIGILRDYFTHKYPRNIGLKEGFPIGGPRWDRGTSNYPINMETMGVDRPQHIKKYQTSCVACWSEFLIPFQDPIFSPGFPMDVSIPKKGQRFLGFATFRCLEEGKRYSPKLWFNVDLPSVQSKKSPTKQIQGSPWKFRNCKNILPWDANSGRPKVLLGIPGA